ncbi:alanyl-tRNA editing protein [Tumebacillus algifaecis]|uniref:Alanine--tRNA ligase n=1 Tax=Tumebacillus algifaecis TaxID=1214604 RepID=A0A223CZQ1_9BACL|nr:DHHA1 domain-containing protein [Tumebacillus algifaecis]ASS74556.1 alanyl-tRNA editing protein [Tumebacillus algifaecis]
MSRKLYYEDAYLKSFTAAVVEHGVEENGTPYVVLDQTAFYPVGGGQPCDLGTINGVAVVDVEEVDDRILHRLAAPLPDGNVISAELDWSRRRDLMQQHTGQHILSAAFEDLFAAETVGFHLGREVTTIDLTVAELTQEMVEQAEAVANRIIFENRPIEARFVTAEELAAMPLRKPPTVTENVRIVSVQDFDYSPCGGTHFAHTGEVGPIKVLSWSKYKGNTRLELVCGWRTLQAMTDKQLILKNLSRQLTSSEADLPSNVERLLQEKKELDKQLQESKDKLLTTEAQEALQHAIVQDTLKIVALTLDGRTIPELQKLGQHITAQEPNAIALLVTSGDKTQLVFARGAQVPVKMNELLKETLPLIEGKGGGNPDTAQGGGSANVATADVLQHALELLQAKLTLV